MKQTIVKNISGHDVIKTIDPDMEDYSKHPYFIGKNARAKANLEKYGLPEGW